MDINFANKVVLVTGASAGIGEATVVLFAKCGARVALVGRDEGNLRRVAATCDAEGGAALPIVADLSTDEGCEKTAEEVLKHFGRLDVLVNNAGVGCRTTLEHTDMATFDRVFATNVRGVYNLTRLLAPALVQTKGNIINVSSVSGSMAALGSLPYGMAKAALDHFTRLISLELAPKGVRVNTVSPGFTESKLLKRITNCSDEEYQAWLRSAEEILPMGQVCNGDDIARMIVFLASDNCRLVTGNMAIVDGGCQFTGNMASNVMKKYVKKC